MSRRDHRMEKLNFKLILICGGNVRVWPITRMMTNSNFSLFLMIKPNFLKKEE
jgi:hypothetical protein